MTRTCFPSRSFNASPSAGLTLLLLFLVTTLQATEPMTRFFTLPGSKVSIKGSNDVHDFGINPPQFGSGRPIKYQDKVEVSVEWLVRRDPAAADKDKQ